MTNTKTNPNAAHDRIAGRDAYWDGEQPSVLVGKSAEFDAGYWEAHADSFENNGGGVEEAYGNFYDYDAVSQGFYDDDPSPYNGDYSEM